MQIDPLLPGSNKQNSAPNSVLSKRTGRNINLHSRTAELRGKIACITIETLAPNISP